LARLPRLAKIAAWIDKQIGLAGLTRLDELTELARLARRSTKKEVPIVLLTWKSGLQRIRPTRKVGLQKIRLTQKTGLYRTRGARNRKKEKVLLQAKGQLYSGSQGVLPRHKNIDYKRCIKESWPRKKKRKGGTIGLPIYSP
jgi:hypothetical protein